MVAEPARIVVTVGGPGTGKTLTLVESVVARVEAGSSLERLLVLAASRAQAQDIRRQITQRLSRAQVAPRVTTVHGLALGLLREEPDADFRLLRAPEQELRIRELLEGLPDDFWPAEYREAAPTRSFARQLREFLARARQRGLDPDQIAAIDAADPLLRAVGRFAEEYLTVADFERTLDYSELVHRARLLLSQASAASSVAARFDAVFADDVQDHDPSQVAFLGDLASSGLPLRVFLDPQQRSSAFRGASGDAVLGLEKMPGAVRRELTVGYRMHEAPARAVATVRQRLSATGAAPAPSFAPGTRGAVRVQIMDDPALEMAHVAAQVRAAHLREGVPWEDMAIVVRTGRSQLLPIARALTGYEVPVEVSGDELPVAEQHAVRCLLTALRLATRVPRTDEALDLLAGPLGGLDPTMQRRLGRQLMTLHPTGRSSAQLLTRIFEDPTLLEGLEGPEAERARRLVDVMRTATTLAAGTARVGEVLWHLWAATPWSTRLQDAALAGSRAAHQEVDAVVELFELAARHENLVGAAGIETFIGEVTGQDITADTAREVDLSRRGVRLLTAHRARSGQWSRVWIVGLQEGSWPRGRPSDALIDPHKLEGAAGTDLLTHLADERRLFYLACSRATESLTVTASAAAELEAPLPSRFSYELGVDPERIEGAPGTRLTAAELVADLRRHVVDQQVPVELRRAAALRLARLADTPKFKIAGTHPSTWWGINAASTVPAQPPEVITITGSSLESLLSCPRQWFLTRRARADIGPHSGAAVGQVVHAIVAQADAQGLDLAGMKELLDGVWSHIGFAARWLGASERQQVEAVLERFDAWRASNPNRLLAVEFPFQVDLTLGGRTVRLRGTVDRLEEADGALRVVDYKTGRSMPPRGQLPTNAQLGIYQLAASLGAFDELLPGVRRVAPASLLMLRHGKVEPVELSQESLDIAPSGNEPLRQGPTWVHDKLAQALDVMDSGEFEARGGPHCSRCPLKRSCPVFHELEVGA